MSDVHSGHAEFQRVIEAVNRERPHLVLDGGDFVHDGTWSEFRRGYADRARLGVPWFIAKGNHDGVRVGPFPTDLPSLPYPFPSASYPNSMPLLPLPATC